MKSLSDHALKASNPIHFNDPFEYTSLYQPEDEQAFFEVIAKKDYIIRQEYDRSPRVYDSFEGFREWWLNNLSQLVRDNLPRYRKNLKLAQEGELERFAEKFRVVSFSRTFRSLLLWSHYASKHTGIVLEFESSDPYLSQVGEDFLRNVTYSSSKYLIDSWESDDDRLAELSKQQIAWKSMEWSYEEETRAIICSDSLEDDFFRFVGKPVRAVYLGCRFDQDLLPQLMTILSARIYQGTEIYQASTHGEEYKLVFNKLSL
ncbi:MAG: DUF2971 domain-containing protein [Coraliomargarita sp.]